MNGFWATVYPGNGRLTGQTTDNPTRDNHGDVVGAVWFEDHAEFESAFEAGQHNQCHSPGWADWACPLCDEAGWNDRQPVTLDDGEDASYAGSAILAALLA